MRVELDVAQFVSAQIKDSKSTAAVEHMDLVGGGIKTNYVCVVTVLDCLQELRRGGIVDPAGASLSVGYKEPVRTRHVQHSLRLMQAGNGMEPLCTFDVEDFQTVVPQRGDKQPLVVQVHREMIDAPLDIGHRNC